jgi:Skp family chaperone for outer membrane proteins
MHALALIDLARVLDESQKGQDAVQQLQTKLDAAQSKYEELKAQARDVAGAAQKALSEELKEFDSQSLEALEEERLTMRQELLEQVRMIIQTLSEERGYDWVLDNNAVILGPTGSDITNEVIDRLNANASK